MKKGIVYKFLSRPLLDMYISIPFIRIESHLMSDGIDTCTKEYIAIHIHIFRWEFKFRLYQTRERMFAKEEQK